MWCELARRNNDGACGATSTFTFLLYVLYCAVLAMAIMKSGLVAVPSRSSPHVNPRREPCPSSQLQPYIISLIIFPFASRFVKAGSPRMLCPRYSSSHIPIRI
ncbi:hypothetical protein CC80DRAFT_165259 [Byssothecium circinans]|uniref:Uncharacterized protein n=1 Tax=Byssothecium circinans TaxID=147558 RepID=A0A6A5TKY6_9PLEO|nr:hypothetical protein CC80DRAFT_165259 [Byssothecium circinans]